MNNRSHYKKLMLPSVIILIFIAAIIIGIYAVVNGLNANAAGNSEDFNIEPVLSSVDYNGNGVDDYTDIMLGARKDAENHPIYDGTYYSGGYPPDDIGVCTDVIWRAFKNAGYCLRDMVDKDIQTYPDDYNEVTARDKNIDFRRVVNLRVFFRKYAIPLTIDIYDIDEWQPGDIVIFGDDEHIGIISDKRNSVGQPYLIHNGGQEDREEDRLSTASLPITAHYRFNAELIDQSVLMAFPEE